MCIRDSIGGLQGAYWNDWGPVAPAVKPIFNWSDGTIALLAAWGPICYFISIIPLTYIMDNKGVRPACIIASSLIFFGSLVKCFTTTNPQATILIHFGQILNALAGPVAMSVGPVISAQWFPPNERIISTACVALANGVGSGLTFFIGPLIIPDEKSEAETRKNIIRYNLYETILFGAVYLSCLLYFPNRPPTSPSKTANIQREDYFKGIKALWKNGQFWICAGTYGIISGFAAGFSSMLTPNLQQYIEPDKAQSEAGWLGFYTAIGSAVIGILVSLIQSRIQQQMKLFIVVFQIFSIVMQVIFALMCQGVLGWKLWVIYLTGIVGGLLVQSAIPLYFEACVELAFPIGEGLTTGFVTTLNNVGCVIFLFIPMIPGLGCKLMNWIYVGGIGISLLLIINFKEKHKRSEQDNQQNLESTYSDNYQYKIQ
eukprot:TRINITY_DN10185_c0_g2_i2.p1 TRINITY_DN10185_c0_g2~~TRINITY_DN10185_c0_g2_i2.p1  ORF type:complete len:428 (+),score=52.75 TRINITY_DN10185_c0_g2_i2:157-1440(+)